MPRICRWRTQINSGNARAAIRALREHLDDLSADEVNLIY